MGNALVDGRDPRELGGNIVAVVPKGQYTVLDDWGDGRILGMNSSGSNSVRVDEVFVPEHWTSPMNWTRLTEPPPGALLHGNPMYLGRIYAVYHAGLVIPVIGAARAALEDLTYVEDYARQVAESKALLYAACDRLGLTYWKSSANFVLVSAGDRTTDLVSGAAERGVYLRDRSTEPGCAGCVRIGTGIVEHTRRCIAVMEEVLCAER
jgi:hypothetical protein